MAREREKTCLRGDLDRLSELPDSLILQILSLLEMKDAVKTGILSKRWKSLWTQVDRVVYKFEFANYLPKESYGEWMNRNRNKFVSFIDATLKQHESNIKVFVLSAFCLLEANTYAKMDDWIRCVLDKKVEVFNLSDEGMSDYAPPDCLLQCSSLTELNLQSLCLPKLSLTVNWNLLKSLCLESIWLSDESLENILLGSPVLESLALEYVDGLERINIISPSVLKLKLFGIWYGDYSSESDGNVILKIRAPWLQELEISGNFIVTGCQIEDLSSLVKATLTFTAYDTFFWKDVEDDEGIKNEMEFNAKWIDMVPHMLKAFSHVAELLVGTELIQVLSLAKLYGKCSPSFQCKHLTINSPLWNYDVLGISCLLESTPHLETLVINVSSRQGERPFYETRLFDDEDMDLTLLNWNLLHLKNVKIDYIRNPCGDNPAYVGGVCNDMEIVGYIMRSVVSLERLVLCSSRPGCTMPGCSKANCSFQYVPRLSSELLTNLLPGNEGEQWELKKRKFCYEYKFLNYYASMCPEIGSEEASC